ncbi:MAG: hypothetical protein SNG81_04880 [Rikenellaceae bacterium]
MRRLTLATDGSELWLIDAAALYGTTTEDINLTVGSANSSYVDGTILTVGNFSENFASITLL